MRLLPIRKISRQSKRLALFLTFCAGYVDAYTFIVRGNTLVAGQTGNVVFLSVELIQNNVSDVRDKLLTLIAFMLGVFLLTIYREKLRIVKKANSVTDSFGNLINNYCFCATNCR